MEKVPPNKIYGAFGTSVSQVCKYVCIKYKALLELSFCSLNCVFRKEKSKVPYLIMSCINEVERRGLKEVGIYRLSGLSSDVQRLKKAFENSKCLVFDFYPVCLHRIVHRDSDPRDACWLIREIDIHAVAGLLKMYLRELPESLFTNDMYQKYFEARGRRVDLKDLNV